MGDDELMARETLAEAAERRFRWLRQMDPEGPPSGPWGLFQFAPAQPVSVSAAENARAAVLFYRGWPHGCVGPLWIASSSEFAIAFGGEYLLPYPGIERQVCDAEQHAAMIGALVRGDLGAQTWPG